MPDEYISRAKALADFEACNAENPRWTPQRVKMLLLRQPAADVADVVHGQWLHTDWAYHWTSLDECSICGYHDKKRRHLGNYPHCPWCGAKMDGGNGA